MLAMMSTARLVETSPKENSAQGVSGALTCGKDVDPDFAGPLFTSSPDVQAAQVGGVASHLSHAL